MSQKIMFFLLIMFFFSCGTKKKSIEEQYESSIDQAYTRLIEVTRNTVVVDSVQNRLEKITIKKTTTWSAPDSAGIQYPEKTEEEETREVFDQTRITNKQENDSTNINSSAITNIDIASSKTTNEDIDTRILPLWIWVVFGVIFTGAIGYILYKVFLR